MSTKQISVLVPNIQTQRVNVNALAYDQHVEKPHMTRNNVDTKTWAGKSYPTGRGRAQGAGGSRRDKRKASLSNTLS